MPIELNSTKARYSTIRGRIEDSACRAARHGIAKENFIIDIGDQVVGSDLRDALCNYNLGRLKYRISRLWVMSQGRIEQLNLK